MAMSDIDPKELEIMIGFTPRFGNELDRSIVDTYGKIRGFNVLDDKKAKEFSGLIQRLTWLMEQRKKELSPKNE